MTLAARRARARLRTAERLLRQARAVLDHQRRLQGLPDKGELVLAIEAFFKDEPEVDPGWHLKLVLLVTELEKVGKPTTRLSLCSRLEGERAELDELVAELVARGRVKCDGDLVSLTEWS